MSVYSRNYVPSKKSGNGLIRAIALMVICGIAIALAI